MAFTFCTKTYPYKGDAADIFSLFANVPFSIFLDSSLRNSHQGRYSFIVADPFQVLYGDSPTDFDILKQEFFHYTRHMGDIPIRFPAGIVGYLCYDFGLQFEGLVPKADNYGMPGFLFGFYDSVLAIDQLEQKLHIFSTGLPEKNSYRREKRAKERLQQFEKKLQRFSLPKASPNNISEARFSKNYQWEDHFPYSHYVKAVQKALKYISEGEIYQVNLAREFSMEGPLWDAPLAWETYRNLRKISPSCFSSFLNGGDFYILSSSPERFLHLDKNCVETRPMKGTRPRGTVAREDLRWREELLNSIKDQAELLMITDLERNDLGRVCRYGSVRVKELRCLEEYTTVYQTISIIEGLLEEGQTCFDLLHAAFPGGSITGCPKIRAMQIIEELEPSARRIYTGSMGYISFNGNMDINILIRTLLAEERRISFHVGGGIVADSNPLKEYEETLVKAKGIITSLNHQHLMETVRRHK